MYTLSSIQYQIGELQQAFDNALSQWQTENNTRRLWSRDPTLWTNDNENEFLGWLWLSFLQKEAAILTQLYEELIAEKIQHIVLLGMGGSSLFAKMIAYHFSNFAKPNSPRLVIIDTTNPQDIVQNSQVFDITQTFFIVASKSGTTLETTLLCGYFWERLKNAGVKQIGKHFMAITDPETPLALLAEKKHYRQILFGAPSIGGRFSALSIFGMAPLTLMGIDSQRFLAPAMLMQDACQDTSLNNPGVILGILMATLVKHKKYLFTLIIDKNIYYFGAWLEQLLAESTGKKGKGIVPIIIESHLSPHTHYPERVFFYIHTKKREPERENFIDSLEKNGNAVIQIPTETPIHLGALIYQFEFATAVAGSLLNINPFNQPDVEAGKQLTQKLLKNNKTPSFATIYSDSSISVNLRQSIPIQSSIYTTPFVALETFLKMHTHCDFFDIIAFLPQTELVLTILTKMQLILECSLHLPVIINFGPQFLHSTAQLYRGGPNRGMFLQLVSEDKEDIQIPTSKFNFDKVLRAQADADFLVMSAASRLILRVAFKTKTLDGLSLLNTLLERYHPR